MRSAGRVQCVVCWQSVAVLRDVSSGVKCVVQRGVVEWSGVSVVE